MPRAGFKAAAPRLGLSPRLVHAVDWLFRFTRPQDWRGGGGQSSGPRPNGIGSGRSDGRDDPAQALRIDSALVVLPGTATCSNVLLDAGEIDLPGDDDPGATRRPGKIRNRFDRPADRQVMIQPNRRSRRYRGRLPCSCQPAATRLWRGRQRWRQWRRRHPWSARPHEIAESRGSIQTCGVRYAAAAVASSLLFAGRKPG